MTMDKGTRTNKMTEGRIEELKTLKETEPRYYVLLSLMGYTDKKLLEIYQEILQRQNETIQNKLQVIRNLAKFPEEESLQILSEAYFCNSNEELRKNIIESIERLRPELTIDFFIDNLDEPVNDLRDLIREHISGNFNSEIAVTLLNRLKDSTSPEKTEAILRIFIENGNASIARKVLDSLIIKDQPSGTLALLFQLLQKFDPFGDEEEKTRTLSEIYFTARNSADHIKFAREIRKMEKHIESIGGTIDITETIKAGDFLNLYCLQFVKTLFRNFCVEVS